MKSIILFVSLTIYSVIVFGQNNEDKQFCLKELNKFKKTKDVVYSNLDEANLKILLINKDGLVSNIICQRKEESGFGSNQLIFTYMMTNVSSFIKNKDNKQELIAFIKNEIGKNDFILKKFILNAFDNAAKDFKNLLLKKIVGTKSIALPLIWIVK
jgi:hypothetical protein